MGRRRPIPHSTKPRRDDLFYGERCTLTEAAEKEFPTLAGKTGTIIGMRPWLYFGLHYVVSFSGCRPRWVYLKPDELEVVKS